MTAPRRTDMRPIAETDRGRLLAWRNSPDVHPFMYADHLITPDEHDRWIEKAISDPERVFRVVELDGEPVGLVSLYDIDRANGRCSLSRYLAEPAARGIGLGAWVEVWLIEYAFGPLGLSKLWSEVLATNETAWRLHLAHGFVEEARFRRHVRKAGAWQDVLGLGLLAEEWAGRREEMAGRLRERGFVVPT